jgi:hypothetical protein
VCRLAKAQILGGSAVIFCNALRSRRGDRSTFAYLMLGRSRRSRDSAPQRSDFVINSAFVIRISSFFLLCNHCLAEIAQFFIYVARVDNCAADFLPQNRTIARTQACHVNAQMCGGAPEAIY